MCANIEPVYGQIINHFNADKAIMRYICFTQQSTLIHFSIQFFRDTERKQITFEQSFLHKSNENENLWLDLLNVLKEIADDFQVTKIFSYFQGNYYCLYIYLCSNISLLFDRWKGRDKTIVINNKTWFLDSFFGYCLSICQKIFWNSCPTKYYNGYMKKKSTDSLRALRPSVSFLKKKINT